MASSPVTAPSTDSPPTPPPLDRATPPTPSSSTSSPPPTPSSSSPPPTSSSSSPPPTSSTSPPPPPSQETSPPPQQTPPPPPATSQPPKSPPSSPPTSTPASPPPPRSTNSSAPPPPSPSKDNNTPPTPPPASKALSPPPPTHRTPPSSHTPTHSKSPPPPSHNESSSTEKLPLIIGVTVGVGILLIVMIIIFVSCAKKKKRRPHDQMQYYSDPSRGPKGSERYNNSQHPNWHNSPQSIDYVVKLPPPPGAMGPPGGGWPAPPPPTHMTSSSEMSSNYSGPHHPPLPPPSPNIALGFNKSTFSYDELAAATNGFTQTNLLGQGGFGYVHKGVLANGKEIAVKSLKSGSGQGEREFQAEVEIISRVHHRHLVSLVGYCIAGGQRLLVYEFVPNKTLEYHLYGKDLPTMDWPTRLRIALGSAKGLAYLHEDCHPRIIHRDIKAANILLDYNFEAMVADFGLAKLSSDNYTHVSTRVMGTFGYLAPEYASSGKLTEKSDVFSYGVMLLELITGRRPVDSTNHMEDSLVDWARPILTRALGDGNYDELVDPRLENKYSSHEMAQMVACAAASIRHSAKRRPKMSQIVRALEGDVSLEDLNEGFRPGQSSAFGSTIGSEYDTSSYNADMKKFRKMALASQEMGSSDYGATSDYGLNHSSSSSNSREMNQTGDHRHIP